MEMDTHKNKEFERLVTGVIYDFMGWLSSRPDKLVLSSADNAIPAANAALEFLTLRQIDSTCDDMIHGWPLLRNNLRIEGPCNLPR